MSILEMTYVSYFFMIMTVLFGTITVIMYFTLDIRRCWNIVRRNRIGTVKEKVLLDEDSKKERKREIKIYAETEKLVNNKTEALLTFEETVPLETITLVQDIVMMDVGNCVNP